MSRISKLIAIITTYAVFGYLGLELASINATSSPIWPASGIAAGMLILFGRQYSPAIFVGSLIVNYGLGGISPASFMIASGSMAEAYITVSILMWAGRFFPNRIYSELTFIPFSAVIGATVSATVGNMALFFFMGLTPENLPLSWFTW